MNSQPPNYRSTLISLHALDPFGSKVGGIETHVRQVIKYRPADMRVILIGVDDTGKLELGKLMEITDEAGTYWFMPVLHCHNLAVNSAAKRLLQSLTLNFFKNVVRYLPRIRRLAKEMPSSLEIQRYEFAWLGKLMGIPYVLTTHGDMRPDQPMDSLLSKYAYLHHFNENYAVKNASHVYSVNKEQTERIRNQIKGAYNKTEFMTVSVDDKLFKPTPYSAIDGPVQIAFVGRLDHFKRPGMMYDVIRRVNEQSPTGAHFHYVGAADPTAFPEYAAIASITTRHGFKNSAAIAALWPQWHLGLVTSVFEGMPVYVLEALCAGRPVCSINLPQMHLVIKDDTSGTVGTTNDDTPETAAALAAELLRYWARIRTGELKPENVNHCIDPYKASRQMRVIYAQHTKTATSLPAL